MVEQLLLLLGTTVVVVAAFQKLRVPSSLGYLLVGLLLGPHTAGPTVEGQPLRGIADLGIVFLLFTTGLAFPRARLRALGGHVLRIGTAQVVLTTAVVGLVSWALGLPPAAAFTVGAVFAQSSTTIIAAQLREQGEEHTEHGRLGLALSVFQDVTSVPFVITLPALGAAVAAPALAASLGWALAKAGLALAVVVVVGLHALRPLFHWVAARRSVELFTLAVLFVSLVAAWTTDRLGLSMPFGAFLLGMTLGETEFRHQVEAAVRPFRDVLLGLFFVGIGMLIDPRAAVLVWPHALAGAGLLLASKAALVAGLVRRAGLDARTAWRTGLVLAVGGEFGLALLALALDAGALSDQAAQAVLAAVLLSIVLGPLVIRWAEPIAAALAPHAAPTAAVEGAPVPTAESTGRLAGHVVICGYGRIGQGLALLLEEELLPYVALDLDPARVKDAHQAGKPVYFGDGADRDTLDAVGVGAARLVVMSHGDVEADLRMLPHLRALRPDLPVMVRTADAGRADELRAAGATEVVPEALEASLMIASHALLVLGVPASRVVRRMEEQWRSRYRMLREVFRGEEDAEPAARLIDPAPAPPRADPPEEPRRGPPAEHPPQG